MIALSWTTVLTVLRFVHAVEEVVAAVADRCAWWAMLRAAREGRRHELETLKTRYALRLGHARMHAVLLEAVKADDALAVYDLTSIFLGQKELEDCVDVGRESTMRAAAERIPQHGLHMVEFLHNQTNATVTPAVFATAVVFAVQALKDPRSAVRTAVREREDDPEFAEYFAGLMADTSGFDLGAAIPNTAATVLTHVIDADEPELLEQLVYCARLDEGRSRRWKANAVAIARAEAYNHVR